MAKRARLAQTRKTAGYTQESFAEALGVDRSTGALGSWRPRAVAVSAAEDDPLAGRLTRRVERAAAVPPFSARRWRGARGEIRRARRSHAVARWPAAARGDRRSSSVPSARCQRTAQGTSPPEARVIGRGLEATRLPPGVRLHHSGLRRACAVRADHATSRQRGAKCW